LKKQKVIKLFAAVFALVVCMGVLCACNNAEYKSAEELEKTAVFYGNVNDCVNESYAKKNLTWRDEDWVESQDFIITSKFKFNKLFKDFPCEIDFKKQMLLIHVSTVTDNGRDRYFKGLERESELLKVNYEIEAYPPGSIGASSPIARYLALVIDKTNISNCKFILKGDRNE